jgi:uncharacterized protein (DUF779 family)
MINLKTDGIAILFILELLKTSQHDKFPTKIAFTKVAGCCDGSAIAAATGNQKRM